MDELNGANGQSLPPVAASISEIPPKIKTAKYRRKPESGQSFPLPKEPRLDLGLDDRPKYKSADEVKNSEPFKNWWDKYRVSCLKLGRSPGGKSDAARAWGNLERGGADMSVVMKATEWDIEDRLAKAAQKKFAAFLPNGSRYLAHGYWETALEAMQQQEAQQVAPPIETIAELSQELQLASNITVDFRHQWNGLKFRSTSELQIAMALEDAQVLFFPNARCRVGVGVRATKESDFLICDAGRWGILEVDGEHWHQVAAKDHDRDRLFQQHGIYFIQRYDAELCRKSAADVVAQFLAMMQQFYQNR